MDLTPYADSLRQEFAAAADALGEDARELAERLSAPLESAIRLTLLEALSAAADEITRELAPGSVDVRLRGREPDFVVTAQYVTDPVDQPAPVTRPSVPDTDDGAMSRINLRLSESLKGRIEEAAGLEHLSVNAWIVRAAAAALDPGEAPRTLATNQRYTGWVR